MCDQNEKRDLKELARSIGREFEMIKPPSPRAIAQQAAGHAGEKVINVDRATVAVFRDRAAAILDGKDPEGAPVGNITIPTRRLFYDIDAIKHSILVTQIYITWFTPLCQQIL